MICGMPTTKKETRRVVPKREVVRRDRGWRWGVISEGGWKRIGTRRSRGAYAVTIAIDWPPDISKGGT